VALAAHARAVRPAPAPPKRSAGPPPSRWRAEIEHQQHDVQKALKTLPRLPASWPGSDPAFVLTPLRAAEAEAKSR